VNSSTPPSVRGIDHVHVHVADRAAAEGWYGRVLGLGRVREYEFWAAGDGPLFLRNAEGTVQLALFERPAGERRSTIALGVGAAEFAAWRDHLARELGQPPELEDHEASLSLYFHDPDGNPYEITTCEHAAARALPGR